MEKNPLISIIIPIYNSEQYLIKCLESVRLQTYKNWECLCVDDGSSDRSGEFIKEIMSKDKRIKYFIQENAGPSSARNLGLSKMQGKYVIFVDSDDYIDDDYIESLVKDIGDADVCCCGYTYESLTKLYKNNDYISVKDLSRESFISNLFQRTGGTVCSKLYKVEVIKKEKLRFNINYKLCEDQLFALEFYCKSKKFAIADTYGYHYIKENTGLSSSAGYERWFQQLALLEEMENIMKSANLDEKLISECMTNKSQNVIFNLMFGVVSQGKIMTMQLLNNRNISKRIKHLKIKDKSEIKYILPLKLKSWILIKVVYR